MSINHLKYLNEIVTKDVAQILRKEKTYQGSWKKRGGVGAFMMAARKWDRLETISKVADYDIFAVVAADYSGADGTALAEIRDLRHYLLLIEAEMLSRTKRGLGEELLIPGTPEDGGHHAKQEND